MVAILGEERGQASAADLLIFGLLVSISSVMVVTLGVGSYHTDLHADSLKNRYTQDFGQSFLLTSRYLSTESMCTSGDVEYTIFGDCEGDLVCRLSDVFVEIFGSSPLDRTVGGSFYDIIASDLYLGLAFHGDGAKIPLNEMYVTGGFHKNATRAVDSTFRYLSSDAFYYRIETSYLPYQGTEFERFLYSEKNYTNFPRPVPDEAEVFVYTTYVAVPVDEDILTLRLTKGLVRFSSQASLLGDILTFGDGTNKTLAKRVGQMGTKLEELASYGEFKVNNRAEIKLSVWQKE